MVMTKGDKLCPNCERNKLYKEMALNPLSKLTNEYVCDACNRKHDVRAWSLECSYPAKYHKEDMSTIEMNLQIRLKGLRRDLRRALDSQGRYSDAADKSLHAAFAGQVRWLEREIKDTLRQLSEEE